MATKMREV